MQKHPFEGDALSQSDSTTYYEDLLSCSDNSTDEGKRLLRVYPRLRFCTVLVRSVRCYERDTTRRVIKDIVELVPVLHAITVSILFRWYSCIADHHRESEMILTERLYTSAIQKKTVMSIEEDSEPILGLWFEETIAPSDGSPANGTKEASNETSAERTVTTTIVPDNREPHGVSDFAISPLVLLPFASSFSFFHHPPVLCVTKTCTEKDKMR